MEALGNGIQASRAESGRHPRVASIRKRGTSYAAWLSLRLDFRHWSTGGAAKEARSISQVWRKGVEGNETSRTNLAVSALCAPPPSGFAY